MPVYNEIQQQSIQIIDIEQVLSGQPCLRQTDLIAQGAQSIELKRTFIPNYTALNEKNGQLHPSKSSFGGWVHFPHAHLNVFMKQKNQSNKRVITETIVSVADPHGAVLSYEIRRGQTILKTKPWGISNGFNDTPSGKNDPRNTSISIKGIEVTLNAPDGTKRFYKCSNWFDLSLNKDTYSCLYCLLQKEILPNGKVLRYQYNKNRQVIKIESLDPNEQYVYAAIDLDCSPFNDNATCTTNTGSIATYLHQTKSYFKENYQKHCVDLLYPLHFTQVNSPYFQNELIKYSKNRQNNACLIEYAGKHPIFKCQYKKITIPGNDEERLQVNELHLPSEMLNFHPVYKMEYAVGKPGKQNSTTTVTDCDGTKTVYLFNAKMLPESIQYFDQNGSLIKTKKFEWTSYQWLRSISIANGQQQLLSAKTFEYDLFGNPLSETLTGNLTGNGEAEKHEIKREFSTDRLNLLLSEEYSSGKVISYSYLPKTNLVTSQLTKEKGGSCLLREFREYDESNNLVRVMEDNGSSEQNDDLSNVTYRRITNYILRQESPFLHMPEWIEAKYVENGAEKLLQRTKFTYDQYGYPSTEHVYDADGKLAYTTEKQYNERGDLLSETNPMCQKSAYTYDAYGREISSTNFSNTLFTDTEYDVKGRINTINEAGLDGIVHHYTFNYDHKDRLTKKTDNFNHNTYYVYDLVANKPVQVETPPIFTPEGAILSVTNKYTYDALGRKILSVDANGNSTVYRYNAYGSPTEIIYPDQSKEMFGYAKNGLLECQTLRNGLITHYIYDTLGNLITKSFFSGDQYLGKEKFEYQGDKLVRSYDKEGYLTQYMHDGAGRKTREERCGCATSYQYDSLGNIAVICEENGINSLYTYFKYDLLGQTLEKKKTDTEGNLLSLISYSYDSNGNQQTIRKSINGKESIDSFVFDSFNRKICHQDAEGHLTVSNYDENAFDIYGQQVLKKSVIDPRQISNIETYDPYGRIVKQETLNSTGQIIAKEDLYYDPCGNLLKQKESVYQGTEHITDKTLKSDYDACNRIISSTRAYGTPDARITTFSYTPGGNLSSKRMHDGITLNYSYDAFDNLQSLYSSDEKLYHSFSYNLLGQLLTATDIFQKLKVERTLDPQGNILLEKFPNGIFVIKTYDNFNRQLTMSLPDGGEVIHTYDPLFLKKVERISPSGKTIYAHQYESYDESGYLEKESLIANMGIVTHETDAKGQSLQISSDYFSQKCFFNEVGNVTGQCINGVNSEFAYDDLSQLISEQELTYAYDSTLNRVQSNDEICKFNSLDEQLSRGDIHCSYDLRGNLIEKSSQDQNQKFTYNALNQLTEAVLSDKKISFDYDPLGRRITKTLYNLSKGSWRETSKEFILYDGNNDIGTLSASGKIDLLRILGQGKHPERSSTIALELSGKIYAPLQDFQGNIRALVDIATKKISASYDYTAFGEQKNSNQKVFNPWQYASKRLDPDLDLIDFGKRYYDPFLGRWLTLDPAGFIDSRNLYQYNFNNPFRYTDPDGRFVIALFIPVLEISFGAVLTWVTAEAAIGSVVGAALGWGMYHVCSSETSAIEVADVTLQDAPAKTKKNHTPDQEAISELVKESGKSGITSIEADVLLGWAKEYNFPARDDRGKNHWKGGEHIHLGPKHVPVH